MSDFTDDEKKFAELVMGNLNDNAFWTSRARSGTTARRRRTSPSRTWHARSR